MTVTEKVAYLKGLVEGLGVDEATKEGRIIKAVVDVLDNMALSVSDMEENLSELSEQVDAVDEDLEDIEKDFYGDEDDEDDDNDEDDDVDYYEVTCPNCGEKVYLDDEILSDGAPKCPKCGAKLDISCDGCGHRHGSEGDDEEDEDDGDEADESDR